MRTPPPPPNLLKAHLHQHKPVMQSIEFKSNICTKSPGQGKPKKKRGGGGGEVVGGFLFFF